MTTRRALCLTLSVGGLVALSGCASSMANRRIATPSAPSTRADLALSDNQIRLRMRSLVGPMSGEIERAADQIIAGTSDPAVKRAAIELKIEAVPALREALFEPDPINAAIDTWVLLRQLVGYFESGPGRTALGGSAAIALEAVRRMEREFATMAGGMTVSGDVSQVEAYVVQFAADHPIRYAIRDRETSLSRASERNLGTSFSAGEVIADFAATADDLSRRLEVYSDQLFRQARWEAQLIAMDLAGTLGVNGVLPLAERVTVSSEQVGAALAQVALALGRVGMVMEGAPTLIAGEREAALTAAHAELARTLEFLQEERITALRAVSDERIAALQHLSGERAIVIKELQALVAAEHAAVTREAEGVAVQVVDHLMWRVAQLVAAVFAVLTVAAVVLAIAIGRVRSSQAQIAR